MIYIETTHTQTATDNHQQVPSAEIGIESSEYLTNLTGNDMFKS